MGILLKTARNLGLHDSILRLWKIDFEQEGEKALKQELVFHRQYQNWQEAKQDIFEYIQVWYNRKRKHSSLGHKSPD